MKLDLNITEFLALFSLLERGMHHTDFKDDFLSLQSVYKRLYNTMQSALNTVQKVQLEDWFQQQEQKLDKLSNSNNQATPSNTTIPEVNEGAWGSGSVTDNALRELFDQTSDEFDRVYPKKPSRSRKRRRNRTGPKKKL